MRALAAITSTAIARHRRRPRMQCCAMRAPRELVHARTGRQRRTHASLPPTCHASWRRARALRELGYKGWSPTLAQHTGRSAAQLSPVLRDLRGAALAAEAAAAAADLRASGSSSGSGGSSGSSSSGSGGSSGGSGDGDCGAGLRAVYDKYARRQVWMRCEECHSCELGGALHGVSSVGRADATGLK
jgi:uncharacterized membrane protein YgcG